jgi:hypothetical protein
MGESLTSFAKEEIGKIHGYSTEYNKLTGKDHTLALLELMAEHTPEIKERYNAGDEHYLIETADVIVMALEIIQESGKSVDEILSRCYARFHKKLPRLIGELKSEKT